MTERIIGNQIRLIPYYRNDAVSLPWYRDGTSGFKKIDTEWYEYRL